MYTIESDKILNDSTNWTGYIFKIDFFIFIFYITRYIGKYEYNERIMYMRMNSSMFASTNVTDVFLVLLSFYHFTYALFHYLRENFFFRCHYITLPRCCQIISERDVFYNGGGVIWKHNINQQRGNMNKKWKKWKINELDVNSYNTAY